MNGTLSAATVLAAVLAADTLAAEEPMVIRSLEHCLAAVEAFDLPPFADWVVAQPYVTGSGLMPGMVQGMARQVRRDQLAAMVFTTSIGNPDTVTDANPEGRFASCEVMRLQLDAAEAESAGAALDAWIAAGKATGDLIDPLPRKYGAPPPETRRTAVGCTMASRPLSIVFDIDAPPPGSPYPLDAPHWRLRVASPDGTAVAACDAG